MLTKIKLLLGLSDTSQDALLNCLIDICVKEYCDITHRTSAVDEVVIQMVIYRHSLLDAQGLSAESYSGASFTYLTDYPEALYRQILTNRKLRTV